MKGRISLKKIGIITLNGDFNYGNRLQNFALQQILKKEGAEVDTIAVKRKKIDKLKHEFIYSHISTIADIKFVIQKLIGKITPNSLRKRKAYKKMINAKKDVIAPFSSEYISQKTVKQSEVADLNDKYDLFIAGSDQVWNPNIISFDDTNFLGFADSHKKFSYSASFGVSEIPATPKKLRDHFRKSLTDFQYISVRENAGKKIIKELINVDVEVAPDPTLLLSKQEWMEFLKPEKYHETPYLLVYFISEPEKETWKQIQCFAEAKGLKIIKIMGDSYDSKQQIVTPLDFIRSICFAEYVITDSFHSCVFSIVMNTPFFVYERSDGKGVSSRIDTLLQTFGLEDTRVKIETPLLTVNPAYHFDKVNSVLMQEKKRGVELIRKHILNNFVTD